MRDSFHLRRLFKPLYITWALATLLVILIVVNFRSVVTDFYGIAESSEVEISYESATIVRQISVIPGQEIGAGQLLVELEQPDLTVELNRVRHRLEEVTADREIWFKQTVARIAELEALQLAATSELDYQLLETRARFRMNRELATGLPSLGVRSTAVENDSRAENPLLLEIERLEAARPLVVEPYRIQIARLAEELQTADPQQIEINRLTRELILLEKKLAQLTFKATTPGLIGAVNFKNGETVPPYSAILTLHSRAPLFVRGYIHENSHNQVAVGQTVRLVSLTDNGYQIPGEIAGVGSRIVSFPTRLAKRPAVTIWGREVMIRISQENNFLLGEKILIRVDPS
ncbi:MAG: efflux RND transporter periplasmic adaptor subunit [Candidatus Delongbacteria bacterium]|nr:efflux RND transporter periplasmic adaptor subunit [Candidatus Delongbacteria bacterium]